MQCFILKMLDVNFAHLRIMLSHFIRFRFLSRSLKRKKACFNSFKKSWSTSTLFFFSFSDVELNSALEFSHNPNQFFPYSFLLITKQKDLLFLQLLFWCPLKQHCFSLRVYYTIYQRISLLCWQSDTCIEIVTNSASLWLSPVKKDIDTESVLKGLLSKLLLSPSSLPCLLLIATFPNFWCSCFILRRIVIMGFYGFSAYCDRMPLFILLEYKSITSNYETSQATGWQRKLF